MPAKAKKKNIVGAWAFLIGVILALILGLFSEQIANQAWIRVVLVIIGILIGLFNISGQESLKFLLIGTSLVLVSSLGGQFLLSLNIIGPIFAYLIYLFTPATIVVAIKSAFALAKD
ncbi:MAG: hypothetical protein QW117_02110 [Candidatus Pacearchaeota archaeon]